MNAILLAGLTPDEREAVRAAARAAETGRVRDERERRLAEAVRNIEQEVRVIKLLLADRRAGEGGCDDDPR
jgi:TRAP-type C4-dicarboxylate transport system substrate-binding protein